MISQGADTLRIDYGYDFTRGC